MPLVIVPFKVLGAVITGLSYAKYFGYLSLLATRCMNKHKFRAWVQDGKQCWLHYVEIEPRNKKGTLSKRIGIGLTSITL